jgi:hypothetical protein
MISLFRTWFLLPKINFEIDFCMLKIQCVKLDFYNLSFQKPSTDQQGVSDIVSTNVDQLCEFWILGQHLCTGL